MRRPLLLAVAALVALPATPVFGQDCGPSRRNPSRFCFALDVIETLRLAHNAYTLYGDSSGVGLAPCRTGGAADVIYRAKQREQAFNQTHRVLLESAASPDSNIWSSIQVLTVAYATYLRVSRDFQRYCKYLADDSWPVGLRAPSQVADSLAQTRLVLNDAGKLLIDALRDISESLADIDPATRKVTILRLSAEQREKLLSTIADAFGPEVTATDKVLSTDFATAAAIFYSFLVNQGWRFPPTRH